MEGMPRQGFALHPQCILHQMMFSRSFTIARSAVTQPQQLLVGFTASFRNGAVAKDRPASVTGYKKNAEELWHQLFSNPSLWWDHRNNKENPKFPDFKHKEAREALWIEGRTTPKWVKAKLSFLLPGTIQKSVFSWTAEISRYVTDGRFKEALKHFKEMLRDGVIPDKFTYVPVLKACAGLGTLKEGLWIHSLIIESQCPTDAFVASCLIDMYSKCGQVEIACRIFYNMPARDLVCWGAMVLGYVNCGQEEKALELFEKMHQHKLQPDSHIFVSVLKACAKLEFLEKGRIIHAQVAVYGLDSDVFVGTSLIDMYAKCGAIGDAFQVFMKMPIRNVVCWSTMIMGHVKCGQAENALNLFEEMQKEHVDPDSTTFVAVLNACACIGAIEHGRKIHAQVVEKKLDADTHVGSALIHLYAKCKSIEDACLAFYNIQTYSVVSWSAMIAAYAKCGQEEKALLCYQEMQREQVEPNSVTFVSVLNACANIAALEQGECIHAQIIRKGLQSQIFVASCLVDMYSKCGSIEEACRVFNSMPDRNVITWNAMIMGYAVNGLGKEALRLFEKLCQDVNMISNTFVCLLSACTHAGLVDQGLYYFESMYPVYDILAKSEHYSCIIDLFGRAGHLDVAESIIGEMWCKPDVHAWMTLLASCRAHGNVQLGERVAKKVLELDPKNESAYVLMSNIFAGAGN